MCRAIDGYCDDVTERLFGRPTTRDLDHVRDRTEQLQEFVQGLQRMRGAI